VVAVGGGGPGRCKWRRARLCRNRGLAYLNLLAHWVVCGDAEANHMASHQNPKKSYGWPMASGHGGWSWG
jgi:hypothetical protein